MIWIRIEFKRNLADTAVDGILPKSLLQSKVNANGTHKMVRKTGTKRNFYLQKKKSQYGTTSNSKTCAAINNQVMIKRAAKQYAGLYLQKICIYENLNQSIWRVHGWGWDSNPMAIHEGS